MLDDRQVAGLFDGEGCARIFKKVRGNHIGYYPAVFLGMTYYPIIKMLYNEFGGHLNQTRHDFDNPKNRIQFCWGIHNRGVAGFLTRVTPHLIVKKEEAELVLKLRYHIDSHPYNKQGNGHSSWQPRENRDSILAYREDLFQRCRALKKQIFPPLEEIAKG